MDIKTVLDAVSVVGFPIVCCGIMFWYLQKEQQSHKDEIKAITEALNKNTLVLTELKDLFQMMTGYGKRGQSNGSGENK